MIEQFSSYLTQKSNGYRPQQQQQQQQPYYGYY